MASKPGFVVYLSGEEKQQVREDAARAGFSSVSDYIRDRLGLTTRKSGKRYTTPSPAPPQTHRHTLDTRETDAPPLPADTPAGIKKQLSDKDLMDI